LITALPSSRENKKYDAGAIRAHTAKAAARTGKIPVFGEIIGLKAKAKPPKDYCANPGQHSLLQ
jgi:hypothetical protein